MSHSYKKRGLSVDTILSESEEQQTPGPFAYVLIRNIKMSFFLSFIFLTASILLSKRRKPEPDEKARKKRNSCSNCKKIRSKRKHLKKKATDLGKKDEANEKEKKKHQKVCKNAQADDVFLTFDFIKPFSDNN
jgi:hypothetical protein